MRALARKWLKKLLREPKSAESLPPLGWVEVDESTGKGAAEEAMYEE